MIRGWLLDRVLRAEVAVLGRAFRCFASGDRRGAARLRRLHRALAWLSDRLDAGAA